MGRSLRGEQVLNPEPLGVSTVDPVTVLLPREQGVGKEPLPTFLLRYVSRRTVDYVGGKKESGRTTGLCI